MDEGIFSFLPSPVFFVWFIKMVYIVVINGVSEARSQWLGGLFKFYRNVQPDCGIRADITFVEGAFAFY